MSYYHMTLHQITLNNYKNLMQQCESSPDMERKMIGPNTHLPQCHPTIVNIVASYQ